MKLIPIALSVCMLYTLSALSFAEPATSMKNPPSPDMPNSSTLEQQPLPVKEPRVDISIQFVNEKGEAIPNLFVYWEENEYYFDYSLYTGSPTNNEGIWTYSVKPGKTRFIVRNINSTLEQIEQSYELNVTENGIQSPYKLTWTNRTPKQLVDETKHKLSIHFEDSKGMPAVGLEVFLRKVSNVKAPPGQKTLDSYETCYITGFTDENGNFTTNLHDDVFYSIGTSDSKYNSGKNHIDVTGGGTIQYTIKAS